MLKLKKLFTLITVITFLFTSCSKDDSSQGSANASIEGKWQFTKEGTITNNQEVLSDYQHTTGCTKDYTEILTGNVIKDHYFRNPNCQETIEIGTWNKNSNTLTITYPNSPSINGEILELTSTTLKFKFNFSGSIYIVVLTRIP
jgi:hypothetical protein